MEEQENSPVIVGIGASAGGIPALQELFEALPETTGAAFVVIIHLDPRAQSELAAILATRTQMPVVQVKESERLQADRVYVIPPDRRLELSDHQVTAATFAEPRNHRAPIDLFFRSLGEHGDGFAVILSGAGSDGAVGVRKVKEAGGIILVQDPHEAEYPSMPRSAIATGIADVVLPVRELAGRLGDLIRNRKAGDLADRGHVDEDLLRRVLAHLRVRTGHDFSKYKRSTVLRRIARRIQVTRTDDMRGYYEYLRDNEDEPQALLSDLLISVTTFFRDREAFDALKDQVLPQLFGAKQANETIRIWVPGCATGEEAYSIAMLLLEESARHEERLPVQVFASDMDARALNLARESQYPSAIEADINEERLRRFFTREKEGYRVRQEVRDMVLFASHDLLKDPPFSRVDLISCRNLLIYLDRELQEQVCTTLHYALNPGGFLLLGSSESADNPPGLFRIVDRNARIYQSSSVRGERPRLLPRLLGNYALREHGLPAVRSPGPGAALSDAVAHRRAIERLAPPSMLVDEYHKAVHLSEHAGRFVQPSGGPVNSDVVDLVRPELRFELRSALHRAFDQQQSTLSLPIPVRFNGAVHRVILHVHPIAGGNEREVRTALVMFIEGESAGDGSAAGSSDQTNDDTVRSLTEELELTQARLRTVREESEAANEELRAANEELQSINEEYRSTSEELETSKEELQSINEELQTVNSELKLKLEAISRAHSDLQNLMAATDFGTLFLDSTLRIKRFTEQVTELFSVTPNDEGRPITDFAHQLEYDDLVRDARAVLADLAPIRREIHSRLGRWYDVRLRPYRTVDDKIDGVVITFVDVTDRRHVEEALRASGQELRQQKALVELSRAPIMVWDFDGGIVDWNRGSEELYGYTRDEAIGKRKERLLKTVVPGSSFEALRKELAEKGSWTGEVRHTSKTGREIIVESHIELESLQGRRLVLESTRDITERKEWERRQQLLLRELTHRVKNALAVVQSIAQQTLRAAPSQEEFVKRFSGRLEALAGAHGLLVQSEWLGADFRALAESQLAAHVSDNPGRLTLEGEPVMLGADLATPFGLVLHELATNAVKYGALSVPEGKVHVSWTVLEGNSKRLRVLWEERNGPVVAAPERIGFGTSLIERGIPNARVKREYRPDGFVCTIEVALHEATRDGETDRAQPKPSVGGGAGPRGGG
ncbi:chemotaxis protein CheB [Chelatococcus caeni]|nr:chemotaxis protein CheB [Chelatococcus caeni]